MNKIIVLGSILGIFLLCGCSTPPGIVGTIPKIDNDYATVYIVGKAAYKESDSEDKLVSFLIKLDDKDFIRIAYGMKTSFKIPVGTQTKISSVSSGISDHHYLDPKKGEKIYLEMDCHGFLGGCWFSALSKIEYDQIARRCKETLVIEQEK